MFFIFILGLITFKNGTPQVGQAEITEILKTYWGLLVVFIILAFLAIFIPLSGLCFCCCRCYGNCGARSQPCDKKRDHCRKILQGTLLIILGTALLFCVVFAFASNQRLQDGIDKLPENLQNGKDDTNTFIKSTKSQANHLLVTNYQEFSSLFISTIDTMRKVNKDLLTTLQPCDISECVNIKNNMSQLQINIDFNKLPDVSPIINKMNELNISNLPQVAQEGKQKLKDIEEQIKYKLDDTLKDVVKQLNEAGDTIKDNLNNITTTITEIQEEINETADLIIRETNTYIRNYGQYRYYGGLAISCILLLVTICIALGLICGVCGKIPDGYKNNCCNKSVGSQFLICAVMLMFILGLLLALITIVAFSLGMASDRVVCYPLRNPENSTIINVIDEYLDADVTLKQALADCYQNKSIYIVLKLEKQFDIDTIHEKFNISSLLDRMNSLLEGIIGKDFTILSPDNEKMLETLKTFDPSINFDQFQDELRQNFINLSLDETSKKLEELVITIDENPALTNVKTGVQLSIRHINMYDEKLLVPMKELANEMFVIAQQLDTDLKMNSSSFSEAIDKLLIEIKQAEDILQQGTAILQTVATECGEMVKDQVNSYLDRISNVTKNELGQCGPLNVVINSTLTATCDRIVLPWNGFWVSLFLSLVLFVPTIIVSVKLSTLYQKYKPLGEHVETEYLYDTFADHRDYIPLNSPAGKRGKKKVKKSKKYEDHPQNTGREVVTREYATGSHLPDTRYADRAPK
ncbi:hypothetical protein NQ314_019090 [Rhamnusium bicolor]|uniref:Prominin-like protein n=1 Tax=Rhamnusium bicolor TaxID=1586634 RepID=A0AAV8WNR7_9CUCU|nr:hypothetical protein NQ314_019090 [Rhamnusium bicolor]